MSDETIRAGDLVVCVDPYPCCGRTQGIGWICIVEAIVPATSYGCRHCWQDMSDGRPLIRGLGPKGIGHAPLFMFRKINPPPISETTEREKELTI